MTVRESMETVQESIETVGRDPGTNGSVEGWRYGYGYGWRRDPFTTSVTTTKVPKRTQLSDVTVERSQRPHRTTNQVDNSLTITPHSRGRVEWGSLLRSQLYN